MDIRKVRALIDLVQDSGIAELEINEGEEQVRIRRVLPGAPVAVSQVAAPAPISVAPTAPSAAEADAASAERNASDGFVVRSPMVGTFYQAPSPDAKPFVSTGDKVSKNQTLCIIEAMKMLNQIGAEVAGEVIEILAENGQPVEFDQPLFVIKQA